MKKVPCFILARKNSKGIKGKNTILLNGIPLILHTINYVKKCKLVSDIVISTDDPKIAKISDKYKCFTIYPRPKKLSNDLASAESALKHALIIYEKNFGETDIVTYAQVTEPFRPKRIIDNCINMLKKNKNLDSCFAAFKQQKNFWILKKNRLARLTLFDERYKPRQIKKSIYREDTGIALATRSKFIRKGERLGKKVKCIPYENPFYNIDINSMRDLKIARKLIS